MSSIFWLFAYSVSILLFSLIGGFLPLLRRPSHTRLQLYLSLSAGVMLGAAFFHLMPDAMEMAGSLFGWWMSLGVVGLFCIERFLAPHTHEPGGSSEKGHSFSHGADHDHSHSHDAEEHHSHSHAGEKNHSHSHTAEKDPSHSHSTGPHVAGWMAVLGLTIHTFMNGVGLAGAVQFDADAQKTGGLFLPGIALFLAVILHKPADALAITTVLGRKGVQPWKLGLVQVGFAAMVPIGIAAFYLTRGAITKNLENQITGFALAFSCGTFILIALSDLLPEVQFHRHDRIPLFLALLFGIVLMGGIALLEGEKRAEPPTTQPSADGNHPND
jgi:zinc and cadmium transporter